MLGIALVKQQQNLYAIFSEFTSQTHAIILKYDHERY